MVCRLLPGFHVCIWCRRVCPAKSLEPGTGICLSPVLAHLCGSICALANFAQPRREASKPIHASPAVTTQAIQLAHNGTEVVPLTTSAIHPGTGELQHGNDGEQQRCKAGIASGVMAHLAWRGGVNLTGVSPQEHPGAARYADAAGVELRSGHAARCSRNER